jgi:hypothetical protein
LIVAGFLGVTVDTLLKAALIRDVGSLFVGWALPQEIRNYIREISQTSIVRRNYQIHYVLRQLGSEVAVQITHDCDVYNYSTGLRKYAPTLAVDLMENPDTTGVALEITRGGRTKRWDSGALNSSKKRQTTPQLIRWHVPIAYWLAPQELSDATPACHTRWTHVISVPQNFSTVASFGTPTIGVTVTCDCPPGLEFECKATDDVQHADGSNRWVYPRLFFNSHIRVYWRPR